MATPQLNRAGRRNASKHQRCLCGQGACPRCKGRMPHADKNMIRAMLFAKKQ